MNTVRSLFHDRDAAVGGTGASRLHGASTVVPAGAATREPTSIKKLLLPLFIEVGASDTLRADSLGFWKAGGENFWLSRFVFQRTQTIKERIRIGIFAGIHGDEPAGVYGLIDFVRELQTNPEIGRDYELWLYPLCNPTGFLDGSRHLRSGVDLNRQFWCDSPEPEVRLLEAEIRRRNFQGIISLHSDDTCDGVYGFAGGATLTRHLLKPALDLAEAALPQDNRQVIDGFHAIEGIIHSGYQGILSAPPDMRAQRPFEIVLETPQHASMDLQRLVFVLALTEILSQYRSLISFAMDL